jgi:2-polyprenyl-3-methyl-5-hydroxy-6-metoxy-1,4-benzoquinol methylase
MFNELQNVNKRPQPFEFYTASELWTDEHTSEQMLRYHLNETVDLSSRNRAFIDRSAEWIASEFKAGPGVKIADFGCGPGLYTTRLARKRAEVTGIDFSLRSIEYALDVADREELYVRYVHQNYLDFETEERFDLILMIMCDFCVLSPSQRKILLTKFQHLLTPGGAVLLDVYSLTAFAAREEAALYEADQFNGFWSPQPYYGFLNTFKYDAEKVTLDKYTIVEAERTRTVYNWLQHFSPEDLEREFADCGLVVEKRFANVAGDPFDPQASEFAVIGVHAR